MRVSAVQTLQGVQPGPLWLVLTGTPMENRLEGLASIMDWVDDRAIEPKWRLGPWHAVATDGRKGIGGARNLRTLRTRSVWEGSQDHPPKPL